MEVCCPACIAGEVNISDQHYSYFALTKTVSFVGSFDPHQFLNLLLSKF